MLFVLGLEKLIIDQSEDQSGRSLNLSPAESKEHANNSIDYDMPALADLPAELLNQIFANVCRLQIDKHNIFLAAQLSRELYQSAIKCFYESIEFINDFDKQELGHVTILCDVLGAQFVLLSCIRRIKLQWTWDEL